MITIKQFSPILQECNRKIQLETWATVVIVRPSLPGVTGDGLDSILRDLISSHISTRVWLILLRTLTTSSLYMADREKIVKSI